MVVGMDKQQQPAPKNPPIVVKLPRNGPKQGQSVDAWLYGKERGHRKSVGTEIWKRSSNRYV